MPRLNTKRNPIIEAGERHDPELDAEYGEDAEDGGQDFDPRDVSADDMLDAVEKLSPAARQNLDSTRKRGTSPHKQAPVHAGRARQETREPRARERVGEWKPADTLFAPAPKPGMENRWIRIRLGEKDDPRNFQKKFREGWKPIRLSDCSEDLEPPTISFGRFGDVVAVSDLVLCERPIEVGIARKRYFQQRLNRQLRSADRRHINKVERDDHPITGRAGADMKPSVGRGTRTRQAPVQGDDE